MASFSIAEVQDNAEGWGPANDSVPEHLRYLDKNDEAYRQYHLWRNEYTVEDMRMECPVCEYMNRIRKSSMHKTVKVADYWTPEKQCGPYWGGH